MRPTEMFMKFNENEFFSYNGTTITLPILSSDDTKDHVLAIDDTTGVVSKRSVSTIGGGPISVIKSGTTTAGMVMTWVDTGYEAEGSADLIFDGSTLSVGGGVTITGVYTGDGSGLSGTAPSLVVGAAAVSTAVIAQDESADTTCNVLFATDPTGTIDVKTGTNLTFNSSTGELVATSFSGTLDVGDISGTLPVTKGGTGRATSTTAYGLLAAGTTATGVHQTLAAGATTELLVGGGASALPVWTTATGTGAPVRAGSPTFTGTVTVPGLISTDLTAGYIPYHFNDTIGLTDSLIYQAANEIGIGTTTLKEKLTIGGSLNLNGPLTSSLANSVTLSYETGYGQLLVMGPDASTNGELRISVSDSDTSGLVDAVIISAGGFVTIAKDTDIIGTLAATTVTGANVTSGADPGHTHTTSSIGSLDASDITTGILPVVRGGTGLATVATSSILTGNGTSAMTAESNLTFDGSVLNVDGKIDLNDGNDSVFVGTDAGLNDDGTANYNTALGHQALKTNVNSSFNVAVGYNALTATTFGGNTAVGYEALQSNTLGTNNTVLGKSAMNSNLSGTESVVIGSAALVSTVSGSKNIAIGYQSLFNLLNVDSNIAIGHSAMYNATASTGSVAIGDQALLNMSTATQYNTAVGFGTGKGITTGINNTIIGANVTGLSGSLSNNIILSDGAGNIKAQHDNTNWAFTGSTIITNTVTASDGAKTFLTLNGVEDPSDLVIGDGVQILFKIPYEGSISKVGASIDAVKSAAADNDSSTDLVFNISQNDETLDEIMRLTSTGDVEVTGDVFATSGVQGVSYLSAGDAGVGTDYNQITPTQNLWVIGSFPVLQFNPNVSDGASAIAYTFSNKNTLSTAGAKLISVKNVGSEKFYIDKDGNVDIASGAEYRINGTALPTTTYVENSSERIVHVIESEVLYTNTSQTTIITLPADAVVWDIQVEVRTGFTGTGTDLLDVGITGTAGRYQSSLDISSTGFKTMSLTNVPDRMTGSTNITFRYTDQNTDAGAGQAYVYVHYSLH
jgi:hypothetical protein